MFSPIVQPHRLTNERYLHFNTSFRRVNEFLVWALNVSSDGEEVDDDADDEALQVDASSVNRLLRIDYKYSRRKRARQMKEKRDLRYSLEHCTFAEHKRSDSSPDHLNSPALFTVGSTPTLMASAGGTAAFTASSASQLSATATAVRNASRANSNDLLSLLVPFNSILSSNDCAFTIQASPSFFGVGSIGTGLTSPNGVASSLSLANFMTAAARLNSQQLRRRGIALSIEAAANYHNQGDGGNGDAMKGKTELTPSSYETNNDDDQQMMLDVEDWILVKAEEAGLCDINADFVMGTAMNDNYVFDSRNQHAGKGVQQRFNSSLCVDDSASSIVENVSATGFSDVPFDAQSVTDGRAVRTVDVEKSDPFYMAHRLFELVSFDQMLKDSPLTKRIVSVDALSNADGFCAFRDIMSTKYMKSPLIFQRSVATGDFAQSRGSTTMSLIVEQRTTSDDGNAEENLNMETKVEEEGEEEYIQVDEDKNGDPDAPTSICATLRCVRQYQNACGYRHQRSVSPLTPTAASQQQFQFSLAETDVTGSNQCHPTPMSALPRKKRDSLLFTVNSDLQPDRRLLGLTSGLKSPTDSYGFEFQSPSETDLSTYRKYANLQQQQQKQQLLFDATATLLRNKARNQRKMEPAHQSQKRVQLLAASKSAASPGGRFPSRILNRMGSGVVVAGTASSSFDVSRRGSVPSSGAGTVATSRWRMAGSKPSAVVSAGGTKTWSLLRNMRSVDNADGSSLARRGENTDGDSSLAGNSVLSSFCQLDPMFEFAPSFFTIDSAFHTVLNKVSEKSLAEYRRRVDFVQGGRQRTSAELADAKATHEHHRPDAFEPSATARRAYAEYAAG